jgi:hypothetical protein
VTVWTRLYSSSYIVRVNKSRMRWTGHVEYIEKGEVHRQGFGREREGRDHLEGLGLDGRTVLRFQ